MAFEFAALLLIKTDDPLLSEQGLILASNTASGTARMRQVLLEHLPDAVTRLVAVMSIEQAQLVMAVHDELTKDVTGESQVKRPPADDVPPTQD
jgi:hypothetical protein